MSASGEPVARVGGVVLLREDGAALMQLRDNKPNLNAAGQWVFPGGHCEEQEECRDCARREFFEETGYDCADLRQLTEFDYISPGSGSKYWFSFWWSRYDGTSPVHCYEGQEMRFIRLDEIDASLMPEFIFRVWELALKAAERDLDGNFVCP
jgi:8-oxo-dGTP pyrophosphatase MutT (NUDIX family)